MNDQQQEVLCQKCNKPVMVNETEKDVESGFGGKIDLIQHYECSYCGYKGRYESFCKTKPEARGCGEKCPQCQSENTDAFNIQDRAFSIHYVDDWADFICRQCGYSWSGQYGYRGLA